MADNVEKDVLRAQRDVAQDVAAETIRERDVARMQRNTVAAQRDVAEEGRAAAQQYAAVEQGEARGRAVGFYVLLGFVALGLLIFALFSLNHSNTSQSSTVVDRVQPNVPSSALTPPVALAPGRSVNAAPDTGAPVVVVAPPAAQSPTVTAAPSAPAPPAAPAVPVYASPPQSAPTVGSAPSGVGGVAPAGNPTAPTSVPAAPDTTSSTPDASAANAPTSTVTNNGQAPP